MPLISAIVPVYNCEKYLPATLDSILNQTFSDFEIIAVNNSSPDGCLQILQDYAKRDARIRVLTRPNGGAGTARNAALDIARGDFVVFCDGDDLLSPKTFEILLSVQNKTNADVVCHGFKRIGSDATINDAVPDEDIKKIRTASGFAPIFRKKINVMACSKLFRRSLFDNLRFPAVKIAEDFYTTFKVFERVKTAAYISNRLYFYRSHPMQITKRMTSEKITDAFTVAELLSAELKRIPKKQWLYFSRYAARYQLFSLLTPLFKASDSNLLALFCNEWKKLEQNSVISARDLTVGRRFVLNALLSGNYEKARKRLELLKKIRL